MIPIGIVAVAGVVPKTIPAPSISTNNFNAYTNNITISAPVGIPVSSYILESSTSASGPWTSVYQGASASFQHAGLTQTTTYFYRAKYSKGSLTSYVGNTFSRATRTSARRTALFRDNGTWTKPIGVTSISYFLIGSGGNGGNALVRRFSEPRGAWAGGGGGAGQLTVVQNATVPSAQTDYAITSGLGVDTTFLGNTAIKGGNGSTLGESSGQNGAHGGGGGTIWAGAGATSNPTISDNVSSAGTSTIGGNPGGVGRLKKDHPMGITGGGGGGTGGPGANGGVIAYNISGQGGPGTVVFTDGYSWGTIGSGGVGAAYTLNDTSGQNALNKTEYGSGGSGATTGNNQAGGESAVEGITYLGGLGGKGAVGIVWRD
jgi:hypothetical protein